MHRRAKRQSIDAVRDHLDEPVIAPDYEKARPGDYVDYDAPGDIPGWNGDERQAQAIVMRKIPRGMAEVRQRNHQWPQQEADKARDRKKTRDVEFHELVTRGAIYYRESKIDPRDKRDHDRGEADRALRR